VKLLVKNFGWFALFAIILMEIFTPLPTSQTMAQSLPSSAVEKIIVRQAQAWENQDAQAIADDFTENAIFIAAGFKFVGKEQISKAAQDYFRKFHQTSVEIKRTIIDGNRGAVEWDWRDQNRKTGKSGWAEDAIVFELANGKIIYWREYIEKKK
jgi:uncharacterized protein (TIGR02246 family)